MQHAPGTATTSARLLLSSAIVLLACVAGCAAENAARTCALHAECLSGECRPDGTCAPVAGDAQHDTTKPTFDTSSVPQDSASTGQADGALPGDVTPGFVCKPDHNNAVERDELTFLAGVEATFRVALKAPLDTKGAKQADGTRVWDLAQAFDGDVDTTLKTLPVKGQWFDKHFPNATYAAQMAAASDLLGVFQATDAQLKLLGVVSPTDGLFATRLTYDPPVTVLDFPLTPAKTWQTDATVSGIAQGVMALYTESYSSKVDAQGALKTPFGNFPVLRVNTLLSRKIGLLATNLRSHFFVAECYGTVATIRSEEGVKAEEFQTAAEIRRWAP